MDKAIYIIGGCSEDKVLFKKDVQIKHRDSVRRYTLGAKKLKKAPKLNHARRCASSTVVGTKIYVVGGHNGDDYLSSIEFLDVRS